MPLLGLLGYKLEYNQRGDVVDGRTYAISHRDRSRSDFPVHIMGYRDSLDRKREDGGPRMSPHGLVQEYLNLTGLLYAIVTNGRQLRLLRDSTRLVKLSYIEFDLGQMIEEGHFADFAVLFRLLHATRMPVSSDASAESLIEQYHQDALDSGSRIRDGLSKAVERSIVAFANGFLRHPDNEALRQAIRENHIDARTYYHYQFRLIYRLLFLMVIEERNLVYPDGSDRNKREIYERYYSVSNLRRLAGKRHLADSRHKDCWMALRNTFRLFEQEKYGAPLGIKPLAGDLFCADAIRHLNICSLDNTVLIACLANLSVFEHPQTHQRIRVNYAALNVEEFGSVYEGLLEYDARITPNDGSFLFTLVKGEERATSGSHYTPDELVTPLIRNSLDHVIRRKIDEAKATVPKSAIGNQQSAIEKALLSITVCDVACGSGHILLNAARRIATEVAIVRTGEEQPSPKTLREAVRDVIRHCIYGVDLNPMAVELCKVALWLESHNPNAPLGFLDHHIKCGNAIVGLAHADELERGIPDEAFKRLPDDDKDVCSRLRKNNRAQRNGREAGQQINYGDRVGRDLRKVLDALTVVDTMPESTPEEVAAKQDAYDLWKNSIDRRNLRIVADLQVAQFFIPKTPQMESCIVTDETYYRHLKGELQLTGPAVDEAMVIAHRKSFYHWFLEFPEVFMKGVITDNTDCVDEEKHSGFDCILGNPPFLGGLKLSTCYGSDFLEYIHYSFYPTKGTCDLVGYFLRRIYSVIANRGLLAIIATNTIAQGETRTGSLAIINEHNGTICFAIKSTKWPGLAAVDVSLLAINKGSWTGLCVLDNKPVTQITSYLDDTEYIGEPSKLKQNENKCFVGSYVLGKGFILTPKEAQMLIAQNPSNSDVVLPYMNGDDINSSFDQSPSRWVINFRDWDENYCRTNYQQCFSIVEERVKPERDLLWNNGNATADDRARRWWQFARQTAQLYQTIIPLDRVLVINRHSKYLVTTFSKSNITYSEATVVFAFNTNRSFAILSSSFQDYWGWKYSSTMGSSTLRYSASAAFETFPFPQHISSELKTSLEFIGHEYYESRRQLMRNVQLGLTKTYNLFHTHNLTPEQVTKASKTPNLDADAAYAAILALRQRHVEMDNAVLAAYGWDNEVDLAHDFYEVDYLPENDNVRFTISPVARREILQRLLKLNHERHAEEVAASLHDKKKPKRKIASKKVKKTATKDGDTKLPVEIPAEPRFALDTDVFAYHVIPEIIRCFGGHAPIVDVARAYALLGDRALVAKLGSKGNLTESVKQWLDCFPQPVALAEFMTSLRRLIDNEFVQWPGDGIKGTLRVTSDAPVDRADAWVLADAALAQAIISTLPEVDLNRPVFEEIIRLLNAA